MRLYHREGDYKGGWWGTRPDNVGPYFDRQKWAASDEIAAVLKTAASDDRATAEFIGKELARHVVKIEGLADPSQVASTDAPQAAITIASVDPQNKNLIANMGFEHALLRAAKATGDVKKGQELFTKQSCIQCHTSANGQTPKGPHLVDIGKRYKREELIESILRPSAKIAQGFDTFGFITTGGQVLTGFVVSESADAVTVAKRTACRTRLSSTTSKSGRARISMMPDGIAGNLTPEELADLLAYLESLR